MKPQKLNVAFNSVVEIPGLNGSAAFTVNTSEVFKEQTDMNPMKIADEYEYMPWGADNEMPYKILDLIDSDETLSTCQLFNAEVCYGSGSIHTVHFIISINNASFVFSNMFLNFSTVFKPEYYVSNNSSNFIQYASF